MKRQIKISNEEVSIKNIFWYNIKWNKGESDEVAKKDKTRCQMEKGNYDIRMNFYQGN